MVAVESFAGFLLAVICLTGWAATLVLMTRAKLDEAKALDLQVRINHHIDETISGVFGRLEARKAKQQAARNNVTGGEPQRGGTVLDDAAEAAREAMRSSGNNGRSPFSMPNYANAVDLTNGGALPPIGEAPIVE